MSQSKRGSHREAWFNTSVGYAINYAANLVLLPLFYGVYPGFTLKAVCFGLIYTVISVVRGYYVRRFCNHQRSSWFA